MSQNWTVLFGTGLRSHALTHSLRTTRVFHCSARRTPGDVPVNTADPLLVSAGRPAGGRPRSGPSHKGRRAGPISEHEPKAKQNPVDFFFCMRRRQIDVW